MALPPATRTLIGSALAVLLVGASFLATSAFLEAVQARQDRQARVSRTLQTLNELVAGAQDAEAGEREFLLTGQDTYRDSYAQGRARAERALAALPEEAGKLVPAVPLDRLASATRDELGELAAGLDLARGGRRSEALSAVLAGEGLRRMETLRAHGATLAASLQAQGGAEARALAADSRRLRLWLGATGLLTLLALGFGAWALWRGGLLRQASERSLADSEARFESLVEGVRDYAIMRLDPEGRVASWNTGARRIKGYGAEEILGARASCFYPPESAGAFEAFLAEAREKGRAERQGWRVRKDGSRFWADVVLTALRDSGGRLTGFAKVTRDLTDRRRVEEELRASEQRFRTLAEAAPIGIYEYDSVRGLVYANGEHHRLTGVPPGETDRERFRQAIHPEDRDRVLAEVEAAIRQEGTLEARYRLLRPDGSVLWVLSRGAPAEGAEGRRTAYLIITQDITEALAAEAEIRAQTEALASANKELEAFAYSVSHDLRAPLRHVDGFVGLLRKSLGDGLSDRARSQLDVISASARQMGNLIDDLLTFSRMGRAEVSRATFDLGALVRRVIDDLAPDLAGREVDWRVGPLPSLHADPALMRLVLQNLLGNAVKFTRGRHPALIEITAEAFPTSERITVRDNGVGFDMQYAGKLFGVFQRLHRQDEFEGTGIGLANVARIIHKHGGSVAAEGALDRGAAFSFTLPKEAP
ncbi:MAG TPA: PAS domain S-box protein [Holophagaceae bacterium]|nr:PAS domain S-box protein [Holophagaceae bacterium]